MIRYVFPFRSNYINIPADGTTRRLDLNGWAQSDLLDGESGYRRRIFRKVYTIVINAEIPREELQVVQQATSIVDTINVEKDLPSRTVSFSEEF